MKIIKCSRKFLVPEAERETLIFPNAYTGVIYIKVIYPIHVPLYVVLQCLFWFYVSEKKKIAVLYSWYSGSMLVVIFKLHPWKLLWVTFWSPLLFGDCPTCRRLSSGALHLVQSGGSDVAIMQLYQRNSFTQVVTGVIHFIVAKPNLINVTEGAIAR